jgi:hypothetical protein
MRATTSNRRRPSPTRPGSESSSRPAWIRRRRSDVADRRAGRFTPWCYFLGGRDGLETGEVPGRRRLAAGTGGDLSAPTANPVAIALLKTWKAEKHRPERRATSEPRTGSVKSPHRPTASWPRPFRPCGPWRASLVHADPSRPGWSVGSWPTARFGTVRPRVQIPGPRPISEFKIDDFGRRRKPGGHSRVTDFLGTRRRQPPFKWITDHRLNSLTAIAQPIYQHAHGPRTVRHPLGNQTKHAAHEWSVYSLRSASAGLAWKAWASGASTAIGQCRRPDALSAVEHRPADVVPQSLVVEYELANRLR